MADSSKTEKATPKKRRDARKKGNVFLSRDAVTVATLIGSFAVLRLTANSMVEQFDQFFQFCLGYAANLEVGQLGAFVRELLVQSALVVVKTAGPLLAVTALLAVAGTFAQTKLLVAGEAIRPKFDRISPLQGFKRLFSMRSIIEALKGMLKITVLLVILYQFLQDLVFQLPQYMYADVDWACSSLFEKAFSMVIRIVIAFTALAAFDFFYQWWDYERQLRMSKQEIKEEYKQMEGDPQIKSKIKEVQRRMAQSRMMQQVPKADVVIRNPTHFAVALRYKPERDNAPVVVAKGVDELAQRIAKVAEENRVAVVENVPLARSLYAAVELNQEIPLEFYGPVAEVLVYIFQLNQKNEIPKNPGNP